MKSFDNFKASVDWQAISDNIHRKAEMAMDNDDSLQNLMSYTRLYSQIMIIDVLREYHEWLQKES